MDRASEEETDWVVAGNKTLPLDGYLSPDSDTDPFSQAPSPDSVITTASTTSTQISVIKGLFKPEYTLQGENVYIFEVSRCMVFSNQTKEFQKWNDHVSL